MSVSTIQLTWHPHPAQQLRGFDMAVMSLTTQLNWPTDVPDSLKCALAVVVLHKAAILEVLNGEISRSNDPPGVASWPHGCRCCC